MTNLEAIQAMNSENFIEQFLTLYDCVNNAYRTVLKEAMKEWLESEAEE